MDYDGINYFWLMKSHLRYLTGYPQETIAQVQAALESGRLKSAIVKKYPLGHHVKSDKALHDYVMEIKRDYMKRSAPISKIKFDKKMDIHGALGIHYTKPRIQGNKIKSKVEIRIADIFKETPEAFLRMVVVHELAHLNEKDHDKAFYRLCQNMEPDYHQLEFDFRVYMAADEYEKSFQ
tara:strand:- start:899 stop:1435 length:537 start_codon:yes stop_codon:yes gene_type:complete